MSLLAEVRLWGRTIGAVAMSEAGVARFEYDAAFADSGIQVAPLQMPLSRRIYSFPELARASFHGLPGLLADSLPDRFGHALIDDWLARQGRDPASFNVIERLCYTGSRGMGALEFAPATGPAAQRGSHLEVAALVDLASRILADKNRLHTRLSADDERAMTEILRVGTSAGGARAKAVIAWHPQSNEVRSGQVDVGAGFEPWLLKFDGVRGNRDKELDDPQGYGAIEYAYALMARDCGIDMTACRLYEEHGRRHFMTRRFDRLPDGQKLHMQSLGAIAHFDFNLAGAHSYEQAFMVLRKLDLPMAAMQQLFYRMVFNVVARNQDDHVKNIALLMDKQGRWSLAPAFDLTYAYNPAGDWTSRHQMSINGKRDDFTLADFEAVARNAAMKRTFAASALERVQDIVANWRDYANSAGVEAAAIDTIQKQLRLRVFK